MKPEPGIATDEFVVNVQEGDYETMTSYILGLLADGLNASRVDTDTIMVKYCGYSLINTKTKKIKSVIKKPDY